MSLDINQFTEIANNFMKHTLALETEDDVSNGLCVLRAAGLISSHLQIDLFAPIEPISIVKSQKKREVVGFTHGNGQFAAVCVNLQSRGGLNYPKPDYLTRA